MRQCLHEGSDPDSFDSQSLVFESQVSAPHLWTVSLHFFPWDLTLLPRLVPSRAQFYARMPWRTEPNPALVVPSKSEATQHPMATQPVGVSWDWSP